MILSVQILFSPADKDHDSPPGRDQQQRPSTPKAIGVEFERNGVMRRAYLNRHYFESSAEALDAYGVILTAGAILTPKLLLNSGIGPARELAATTPPTPVQVDLPGVGKNLQVHPTVNVKFNVNSYGTAGGQWASR